MAFFSKSARSTLPQKFTNEKLDQIKHSCKINLKSVRQIFCKIGKGGFLPILKIAQNLSYRFFLDFDS